MERKGFAPIRLIVIAAALVIVGGVWYYKMYRTASQASTETTQSSLTDSTSTAWQLYQSGPWGVIVEIMYPPNWTWNGATYAISSVNIATNLYSTDMKPYSQIPGIISKDFARQDIRFLEPTTTVALTGSARWGDLHALEAHYTYLTSEGVQHERRVAFVEIPTASQGSATLNIVSIESTSTISSSTFDYFISTLKAVAGPIP